MNEDVSEVRHAPPRNEPTGVRVHDRIRADAEHARVEEALTASEARLRIALDVAELGTWTWDLATGMGDVDARGGEIVGLAEGQVTNVVAAQADRVHPDDLASVQVAVAAGISKGDVFDIRYRVIYPDGSVHHVASRALVIADVDGHPTRLVGTNRDTTAEHDAAAERERLMREAESARQAAEAANRSKSEFLAVMSHELRTPLNAISGYADLMQIGLHGPLTDAQRSALDRIQQSQRHLLAMINTILDFAKVDAGAIEFEPEEFVVQTVLSECESLTMPQMMEKSLSFENLGCLPSVAVWADREKVQQVVLNLLSNAIKCTPRDGSVRLVACLEDDGRVAISVSDTGHGIPADKLERIFEPFVQIDVSLTRRNHGTGLGLAISRELARGMDGDVTLVSEVGVGSTFTLRLPASRPSRGRGTTSSIGGR